MLLSGCVTADTFDVPPERRFVHGPQLDIVVVTVVWLDLENVSRRCRGKRACADIGTHEKPFSTIYSIKPDSFADDLILRDLGEEVLHALGATHRE